MTRIAAAHGRRRREPASNSHVLKCAGHGRIGMTCLNGQSYSQITKVSCFVMVKYPGLSSARHMSQGSCGPHAPCAKCALFQVIRVRFKAFQKQFGRDPGPNEPLFFDSDRDQPVPADIAQAVEQIKAAARALKIEVTPVLEFLNLNSATVNRGNPSQSALPLPIGNAATRTNAADPGKRRPSPANRADARPSRSRDLILVPDRPTKRFAQREPQSGTAAAWKRFVKHEGTHGTHNINPAEWEMLSKVAMMGEVLNSNDFIFILNTIRQALRS